MDLQAAQSGRNYQVVVTSLICSFYPSRFLSHPGHPVLVNSMRHESWQVFYDLLTKVHLVQSRSGGFHPVRAVCNYWTENNWSVLSWLCTRTSLHIQVLLPSAFQKLIPIAFSPLDVVMLVRDTSHPGNKGWSLCQPQLSGKRLDLLCSWTQWCGFIFPGQETPLCFTHHVWPCVSFETTVWNGCCHLMNTLEGPLL